MCPMGISMWLSHALLRCPLSLKPTFILTRSILHCVSLMPPLHYKLIEGRNYVFIVSLFTVLNTVPSTAHLRPGDSLSGRQTPGCSRASGSLQPSVPCPVPGTNPAGRGCFTSFGTSLWSPFVASRNVFVALYPALPPQPDEPAGCLPCPSLPPQCGV